jgi:uncharacterized protein YjdB
VNPGPITSLSFDSENIVSGFGESYQLKVKSNRGYEDPSLFTWVSTDPGIAQADPSGLVTCLDKIGFAQITAHLGYWPYAACNVAVVDGPLYFGGQYRTPNAPFKNILTDGGSHYKNLYLNDSPGTFQLDPKIVCSDGLLDHLTFSYESDDPSIASVSDDGLVAGLKVGSTKVRGRMYVFGVLCETSESVIIRVLNKPTDARLDTESLDIWFPGSPSAKLSVACDPPGASVSVDWSSSAPGIVAVDYLGNVTAKAVGSATVTAKVYCYSGDSYYQNSLFGTYACEVTVHESVSAVSVGPISPLFGGFLVFSDTVQLAVVSSPDSVQLKLASIEWSSSSPSDTTVDSTGLVKTTYDGPWKTVTITAKVTDNGGTSASGSIDIKVGTP